MEIEPTSQGWFNAIVGLVVGLLGTLFGIYRSKVDRMEDHQQSLERRQANFITRDELERHIDQMRSDRLQQHTENLLRLKAIGDDINRVHDRIDQALDK
jgi:uncharacterized membrane-anchored protein YhcB (DUF1043 family)